MKIKSVLIANRGEIANRVVQTLKKMNIESYLICSEADQNLIYTQYADYKIVLPGVRSEDTYLNQDLILEICHDHKIDAIHPGYGFLSESSEFRKKCEEQDILFIGPGVKAMEIMGSKLDAKLCVENEDVSLLPGYHGKESNDKQLKKQADLIGFPLLIKAAAGGGGKGMKICTHPDKFDEQLQSAKREALSAFGNDDVILEKYIPVARHIEVQIFADKYGNIVALGDRECSLQRRYQKVIEEAPAPNLPNHLRTKMHKTACLIAKAVDYQGAGTVEFLVDAEKLDDYYFIEMNTRLQVEHRVTEEIFGIDLVQWQIECCEGLNFHDRFQKLKSQGSAVEVRVYAEDVMNQFLPATGELSILKWPKGENIYTDFGYGQGDVVTPHYDPMLAKIIGYGKTRDDAVSNLNMAFAKTKLLGCRNNISFLRAILNHDDFSNVKISTKWIDKNLAEIQESLMPTPKQWAQMSFVLFQDRLQTSKGPWQIDGWRTNLEQELGYTLVCNGQSESIAFGFSPDNSIEIQVLEESYSFRKEAKLPISLSQFKDIFLFTFEEGISFVISEKDKWFAHSEHEDEATAAFEAPMPGRVTKIYAKPGQVVKKGEPVIVLEAMKMEHTFFAPSEGKVKALFFDVDGQVQEGDQLVEFEAAA